ncbi:sulfite exporter TauE/SafE family protein [Patulibacter defluvii]|uniref:sulfite exporter TauE/SafE family protein n=1 Tax=Patulibacter defluvii TaxID=3095358 RepID=UPI002A761216|nr:sulfite exporter TauE/SafE family protein [Patulibacter sp. DM4]
MAALGAPELIALALCGLAAGIGITAVGPGGVLATIGLVAFTGLPPATVAGTAIVTHVATGALGTAAYRRSGQLRQPPARRSALILAAAAVVATPLGVLVNAQVSGRLFGILLGAFAVLVAGFVWSRRRRDRRSAAPVEHHPRHPLPLLAAIGLAVAVVSGLLGLGGPMLAVPLLVAIGVPLLSALAAAQAQSVVIAGVGTIGYVVQGAVDWPLAALVGVPELGGVLIGWKIARTLPTRRLEQGLILVLLALAPYLALHG